MDDKEKYYQSFVVSAIEKSTNNFVWFVKNIFALSFDNFVYGQFIEDTCNFMEKNKMTVDISARDHFKSTRIYAEVMYRIFTNRKDEEAHLFSYVGTMSSYHISKIKEMIKRNPFFPDNVFVDQNNSNSEIVMKNYFGVTYSLSPQGLLSFKRGIHSETIYLDDPLRDPENKLEPTIIVKINKIVKTEIIPMLKKGGTLRITGTPQSSVDFFFDKNFTADFAVRIQPAIINENDKLVIFPEWKSYEELVKIRNMIGRVAFSQEYLCMPIMDTDSYLEIDKIHKLATIKKNISLPLPENDFEDYYAGFDIGKKRHPSHLAIFRKEKDIYVQVYTKFYDHIDYIDQIEDLLMLDEFFHFACLKYDNTRGEFESFKEQGKLPEHFEGVTLTRKREVAIASKLNSLVVQEKIAFINDERTIGQMLTVNSDLKAMETPQGHGDSFWSVGLAVYEETPTLQFIN
ncbi:MAG: hypothetical protein PHE32_04225 [Candidatus Shapirobacteria bacterium]|nr:hypothetical protein [Candidatus Shapirobacteria bacterium]